MVKIFSLSSIWDSIGISNLSCLGFLKVVFLVIIVVLNIGLLYLESLEIKSKSTDKTPYMQSGSGTGSRLKRIAGQVSFCIGVYSGYITIRNDRTYQKNSEQFRNELEKAKLEAKEAADEKTAINFTQKMHIDGLERSFQKANKLRSEQSELRKFIEDNKATAKFKSGDDERFLAEISRAELRLFALDREEERAQSDLKLEIEKTQRFATEISGETEDQKILALVNEDFKKSTILDLDGL